MSKQPFVIHDTVMGVSIEIRGELVRGAAGSGYVWIARRSNVILTGGQHTTQADCAIAAFDRVRHLLRSGESPSIGDLLTLDTRHQLAVEQQAPRAPYRPAKSGTIAQRRKDRKDAYQRGLREREARFAAEKKVREAALLRQQREREQDRLELAQNLIPVGEAKTQ